MSASAAAPGGGALSGGAETSASRHIQTEQRRRNRINEGCEPASHTRCSAGRTARMQAR